MKTCALLLSLLLTLVGDPAWAEDQIVTGPDRRNEIDLRIEALDAERAEISTRGAKTATLIGLGTMVVGAVPLAVGLTTPDYDDDSRVRSSRELIAGCTLVAVGAFTALGAGFVWSERIKHRNEIDAERELLIEKRDGLAATLSRLELHSPYRDGTQFVTLGVRF